MSGPEEREDRIVKVGPMEVWGRRREEPLCPEFAEAVQDLKQAMREAGEPIILPILRWLDSKFDGDSSERPTDPQAGDQP